MSWPVLLERSEPKPQSVEAKILEKYKAKFEGPAFEKLAKAVERGITKTTDLCDVYPPACRGNLGMSREKMPQFSDEDARNSFFEKVKKKDIRVTRGKVRVDQLKASQAEMQAQKVIQMAGAFLDGNQKIKAPIIISKDGYVVDGHHRWAAVMMVDPADHIDVIRVGMPIRELIAFANAHPGIERRGLTAVRPGSPGLAERYVRLADVLAATRPFDETRMGASGLAYTTQPVSIHGVGISPNASPADMEAGRYQSYADGPSIRRRKPGYKPTRIGSAGAGGRIARAYGPAKRMV